MSPCPASAGLSFCGTNPRARNCRAAEVQRPSFRKCPWPRFGGAFLPGSVHLRNRRVCHQRRRFVYGERTDAKRRAAQATEPSIKSAYEKVAEHWMLLARLGGLSLPPKGIAKTPSKKLTALPPGEVAADTQRAKESPGHTNRGFSNQNEEV